MLALLLYSLSWFAPFTLQLRTRVQIRYDLERPNAEGQSTEQSMQIRRARLPLQLGFSPRDQTSGLVAGEGSMRRNPLRDARVEFDYLRDFTIWAGQMKVPFSRQRVLSSGNQNLVDRSLPNDEFQLDRDIGVQALSNDTGGMGWLAYNAGVFMGEGATLSSSRTPRCCTSRASSCRRSASSRTTTRATSSARKSRVSRSRVRTRSIIRRSVSAARRARSPKTVARPTSTT